jgi:oxygen-independent coproporphyrinogen-3 oxidase
MTEIRFDTRLMHRYDREAPRYTSYPTAVQFKPLTAQQYEIAAAASAGQQTVQPLSLYVHVPFCYSPCFYCACNKVVTRRLDRTEIYFQQLLREVELRSAHVGHERTVEQLHFGGGTPTYFPLKRLGNLIDHLDRHFGLTDDEERDYSIEIDPRTVNAESLRFLKAIGFNRISLGVQDLNEQVQRAVNRLQPLSTIEPLFEAARRLNFKSVNVDLIYGLPLQTAASFADTLDAIIKLRPDRLAVYGYAHMPHAFKAQRQIRWPELPNAIQRMELLNIAVTKLTDAGYEYIGMDHFALPTDSLALAQKNRTLHRNFQGYTTHAARDLIGLGVSSIGIAGNLYGQNHKDLLSYGNAIEQGDTAIVRGHQLTNDDLIRRSVIQDIMCYGEIDIPRVEQAFSIYFPHYFERELAYLGSLEQDGLLKTTSTQLTLTPAGRLLMRHVALAFDAYQGQHSMHAYSKVV